MVNSCLHTGKTVKQRAAWSMRPDASEVPALGHLGEPLAFSGHWRTKEAGLKYQHRKDNSNNRTARVDASTSKRQRQAGKTACFSMGSLYSRASYGATHSRGVSSHSVNPFWKHPHRLLRDLFLSSSLIQSS